MPDGMTPENSNYDQFKIGGPAKLPANEVSMQYAGQVKKEHSQDWISEKHSLDARMSTDPNNPNYDPLAEALARGIIKTERSQYEHDPFGLYSAAGNLAESMLGTSRIPIEGSLDFKVKVETHVLEEEQYLKKISRRNGQQIGITEDDKKEWRDEATKELLATAKESKETLERNFRLAIAAGNRGILETLDMLEAFVPPKPFEANMQERDLLGGRKTLEAVASYFDSKLPEKIIGWYRKYDAISEQQIGLFNILCAGGGGLEGYFDAVAQAGGTLLSRSRFHANMADLRAAYTNDNPGVTKTLTPEQSVHIKDTLASKEIREIQVEMLSQARRLILFNTDVAQYDAEKPVGEEGIMRLNPVKIQEKIDKLKKSIESLDETNDAEEIGRINEHINSLEETKNLNLPNHRKFMRLVFGEIDEKKWITWKLPDTDKDKEIKVPEKILTWYASDDKLNTREDWESKMLATLLWVSPKDGSGISSFLKNATEDEILTAAKRVLEGAKFIRANMKDKTMNSDLEFTAAKIALNSWLENDKAFQKSGELAWKWDYINTFTKDGKKYYLDHYVRSYEAGGIYKAFDSINLKYYWRRWTSYKAGLKSATTFFGPASDAWRREVSRHSPDWLPSINEINKSPKIKSIHDRFFDTDPEHPDPQKRLWRAQRLLGNSKLTEGELNQMIAAKTFKEPTIDKNMQKFLIDNSWTFGSAYGVQIPMFLPKTFPISLDEQMAIKAEKETVGDQYAMGILPKDIDWGNYNYESLDRMWVSMSMLTKFAHLFVDSYDEQRDSDFQKFFVEPGVQSIAEMAKRVYLAYRDRPEGYQPYILSIVPYMIAQHEASETGLLSTDLGSVGSKEKIIKKWNFKMAKWIRAAMWTPEVLLDDQQLYDGANADIQSMRNDIALMIMYYKHVFEKVGQAAYKSDKGKLSKFYNDQLSTYKGTLMQEMSTDDSQEANFDFGSAKMVEDFSSGEKAVEASLFGDKR